MRKANQFNFLVSVPADPMAEPFTKKSDPLRGPIFIPLCTTFLPNGAALFDGTLRYLYLKQFLNLNYDCRVSRGEQIRQNAVLPGSHFGQVWLLALRFGKEVQRWQGCE